MLVLDYEIECDLLEEGNMKIVDGEIEITSETFLRELGKRVELELDHVWVVPYADLGGPAILANYTLWGGPNEFCCLDIGLVDAEMRELGVM